jgi:tetratricopeptide (TPR) repeat protein
MGAALAAFDAVAATPGLRPFGLYHKALALAAAGDFEGAEAILSLPPGEGMQATRRAIVARAQVLSQLGRGAEAAALIEASFPGGADPGLAALRDRLLAGQAVPFSFVSGPRAGLAEAYLSVAAAIASDTDPATALFHGRIARVLDPGNTDATLFVAQILERMDQGALAAAAYAEVAPDDPSFYLAEIGRAEVMRRTGDLDGAVAVLESVAASFPELALVQAKLGDVLRIAGRDAEAVAAYGRALPLFAADDPQLWIVRFARGRVLHRMGDWPGAEADFRAALALRPGQAQVLNYYGYSLVERRERLDEALAMIEEAVRAEPQNGAIVDSLGWALFRLGRHEEAVVHMEQAAALEPSDPVVNDHLGDVFWAVGRKREAAFQWRRALSFGPDEAEAQRIRRKLEIGLDAVLAEEGAPPLVATGSGG